MRSILPLLLVSVVACAGCEGPQIDKEPVPAARVVERSSAADARSPGLCSHTKVQPGLAHALRAGKGNRVALGALNPATPDEAVDHVVTYAARNSWDTDTGARVTLSRSGALIRMDSALDGRKGGAIVAESKFYNLATLAGITSGHARDGSAITATLWHSGSNGAPYSTTRTSRTETIAGETCRVWDASSEVPNSDLVLRRQACITRDGIVLSDTTLYGDGAASEELRALSVERRNVSRGEVLPPRELLDWNAWTARADTAEAQGIGNYSLTLARTFPDGVTPTSGDPVTQTFLADGNGLAHSTCSGLGLEQLRLASGGVALAYDRGRSLTIALNGQQIPIGGPQAGRPLDRSPSSRLGETCTWIDADGDVADYNRNECRTEDGLPLLIEETSWARPTNWQATSLERGTVENGAAEPSRALLDWENWGWPAR